MMKGMRFATVTFPIRDHTGLLRAVCPACRHFIKGRFESPFCQACGGPLEFFSLSEQKPANVLVHEMLLDRAPGTHPPAIAEIVLALAVRGRQREAIVGDMDERFGASAKKLGRKRAARLYWAEVIRSVAPLLWAAIKRLGIAAALVDAVKQFFGGA